MSFFLNNVRIPVTKCKKPTFKDIRGRTWDMGNIIIDGIETKAYLDTSWGVYIYFQHGSENKWYKVKMQSSPIDDLKGNRYDVDPFSNPYTEIITK